MPIEPEDRVVGLFSGGGVLEHEILETVRGEWQRRAFRVEAPSRVHTSVSSGCRNVHQRAATAAAAEIGILLLDDIVRFPIAVQIPSVVVPVLDTDQDSTWEAP